jgi:hypothetical protein
VVGYADLAFRRNGENATIGATHRRKTRSRKMKNDASKTLGKRSKKQHDTPRTLQVGYRKYMQQPLSEMRHTHRDFYGFFAPPSYGWTQASANKKCYNYVEREVTSPISAH